MMRYIFKKWDEIRCTDEITTTHLVWLKDNLIDFLIDTKNGTYFDAENNEWKDIVVDK